MGIEIIGMILPTSLEREAERRHRRDFDVDVLFYPQIDFAENKLKAPVDAGKDRTMGTNF